MKRNFLAIDRCKLLRLMDRLDAKKPRHSQVIENDNSELYHITYKPTASNSNSILSYCSEIIKLVASFIAYTSPFDLYTTVRINSSIFVELMLVNKYWCNALSKSFMHLASDVTKHVEYYKKSLPAIISTGGRRINLCFKMPMHSKECEKHCNILKTVVDSYETKPFISLIAPRFALDIVLDTLKKSNTTCDLLNIHSGFFTTGSKTSTIDNCVRKMFVELSTPCYSLYTNTLDLIIASLSSNNTTTSACVVKNPEEIELGGKPGMMFYGYDNKALLSWIADVGKSLDSKEWKNLLAPTKNKSTRIFLCSKCPINKTKILSGFRNAYTEKYSFLVLSDLEMRKEMTGGQLCYYNLPNIFIEISVA